MVAESNNGTLNSSGIVYLLINEAMPSFVKIGETTLQDPQVRIDDLYNTSIPVPFECVSVVGVDPAEVEGDCTKHLPAISSSP